MIIKPNENVHKIYKINKHITAKDFGTCLVNLNHKERER